MIYAMPAVTAAMAAYILWLVVFRLRRDRIRTARERTRGKFAFSPGKRARLLLSRAFEAPRDAPEWQDRLISALKVFQRDPTSPPRS